MTRESAVPDGIFGVETGEVVSKFQVVEKLGVDGIVGKATLAKLDALLTQKASPPPPVVQHAQSKSYELDYTYKFFDRYNWDKGKAVTLFGVKITDHFIGEFHRQGLAREFDCVGSVRRRFVWKHGDENIGDQLSSPVTTERGP